MALSDQDLAAIKYVQALKRKSAPQKQIAELAAVAERTPEQEKLLKTLLRAHHAQVKANQAAAKLSAKIASREATTAKVTTAASERQKRNKRLIEHGLLIEAAGLQQRTEEELVGALQLLAQAEADKWMSWASRGRRILADRTAAAAARKAARKEAAEAARRAAAEAYQLAKEEALQAAEQAALAGGKP